MWEAQPKACPGPCLSSGNGGTVLQGDSTQSIMYCSALATLIGTTMEISLDKPCIHTQPHTHDHVGPEEATEEAAHAPLEQGQGCIGGDVKGA